jgi:hypothetical protein
MTALLDVLVAVLLFLLVRFESSSECGCLQRWPRVPEAATAVDLVDASVVKVWSHGAEVDGQPVAGADDAEAISASDRVGRLDALFDSLKAKRELWKRLHGDRAFPGIIALAIDEDVPAVLVKTVVSTAAHAGYPHIHLVTTTAR